MVLNELVPVVKKEILKWYWRQGGKWISVHYGHPAFKADFWPEFWPWENVKKSFVNLSKEDYTGPGNLTECLKTALRNLFANLSIDPATWVSKNFTERQRKNRQRHRGIHHQPQPQVVGPADDSHEGSYDDDQGGSGYDYQGGPEDDNQGGTEDDNQGGTEDDNQGGTEDDNQEGPEDEDQEETEDDNQGGSDDEYYHGGPADDYDGGPTYHFHENENHRLNISDNNANMTETTTQEEELTDTVTMEDIGEDDDDLNDISNVLRPDLLEEIEQEIGRIPTGQEIGPIPSISEQNRTLPRASSSVCTPPPSKRPRAVPGPPGPSLPSTSAAPLPARAVPGPPGPSLPSTSAAPLPFRPFRKGPSELNKQRIPSKEPRTRIHFNNDASPIRNVGMCSTPPRIIRGRRNASQTASALQSERLDQPITIQIASDLIDAFKEISEGNSIAKKETGAILAGYKVNDHYVMDTLFVPQQVGFADWFEATDELDIDNFLLRIQAWSCWV